MEPNENYELFFPSGWNFESFDDENQDLAINDSSSSLNPNYSSSFLGLITSPHTNPNFSSSPFNELSPFLNGFTPLNDSSNDQKISCIPPLPNQDHDHQHQSTVDDSSKKRNKSKKIEGQPSKNLMAERRRRKRLNNHLSLLRSIVPKISKMDKTAILGDTIDYMKELLDKIKKLKKNDDEEATNNNDDQMNLLVNLNEDGTMRNSSKFDVEKRDIDTRIEIRCATKPGMLLSTLNIVEALGLDIQQCVISCFSDFSLQASCSQTGENRTMINSEEMKQISFKNAGYGETLANAR